MSNGDDQSPSSLCSFCFSPLASIPCCPPPSPYNKVRFSDDLHDLQHHSSVFSERCDANEVLVCVDEVTHSFLRFQDEYPIQSDRLILDWSLTIPNFVSLVLADLVIHLVSLAPGRYFFSHAGPEHIVHLFKQRSLHLLGEVVGASSCPSFKGLLIHSFLLDFFESHQPDQLGHFFSFRADASRGWYVCDSQNRQPQSHSGRFFIRVFIQNPLRFLKKRLQKPTLFHLLAEFPTFFYTFHHYIFGTIAVPVDPC